MDNFQIEMYENQIELNEDALEYGSEFLSFKYWFSLGWESRKFE